jgi:hypothetical protein
MVIIKYEYQWVDGKLMAKEKHDKYLLCNIARNFCRYLFEAIHFRHYQQKYNGKKRLKTIKITGLRSALVDDVGQRKRMVFYWKIGKYYL